MANQVLFTIRSRTPKEFSQKHSEMSAIAARDSVFLPAEKPLVVAPPTQDEAPPAPPEAPARTPYFDIGDGEGKPGDIVEIIVEAGCVHAVNGFHIGGGVGVLQNVDRSGYRKFRAVGVKLGEFLRGYLEEMDLIHNEPFHKHKHFWSAFQFIKSDPQRALPEEFWEYAIGFFSIDREVGGIPPISIPGGTELFTVQIQILDGTPADEYVLTCKDEYFSTQKRRRKRDYMFTANGDSEFASGGVTSIETFPGLLIVKAWPNPSTSSASRAV